ncbi:hypothetical protein FLONG3_1375 [Fusarium longipes]|uniref:Tyrosine-protein phosphatase domain-containing protein n=1 Tax=Fusarium longipes TaxID=694270 RepID=A0A395T7A0_9HYPO|nr:hypothetical protein FLONG3_1375 [Fusarium longipes]
MEDEYGNHPSTANNSMPSAPYSRRAPSPPFIHIPTGGQFDREVQDLLPSYENVDPSQLTPQEIQIITRDVRQTANDRAYEWSYEQRREAQMLVDFLYLGPNSAAKDHEWLRQEGITMFLVVRDSRMAGTKLNGVEKAAQALGITLLYVNLEGYDQLIPAFSSAIRAINDHLLSIYHQQANEVTQDGAMKTDPSKFQRGKVLITCETGNDRSAALAAAYIMAVFGKDMITTVQFISVSRFCCVFDEDVKRKLQSWEDILRARSQVGSQVTTPQKHTKRQIDDYFNGDDEMEDYVAPDQDRFEGRGSFVPFVDI